ncbi:hypothetical protein [Agrobacterium cavarae]|uniref:hypothetical protein n=1 Tax=Agrobacterium cavarae TaxID=2528239 RepID=UPI003FD67936
MTLNNAQISARVAKHGRVWIPDASIGTQPHTAEYLASAIQDFFSSRLTKIFAITAPRVSLNFVLIDNPDLNAFAGRYNGKTNEYLIGVYRGTFVKLRDYLYDQKREQALRKELTQFAHFEDPLALYSCFAASGYVIFHEFAHIIRGHVDYLNSLSLDDTDLTATGPVQAPLFKDRERYLAECEADTYGGRFSTSLLYHQIEPLAAGRTPAEIEALFEDLIALTAFANQSAFRLMEDVKTAPSILYPAPTTRSGIVNTQLMKGLEDMASRAPHAPPKNLSDHVKRGLKLADELANDAGLKILNLNAQTEGENWIKNDQADVNAFATKLKKFRP